MKICTVDGCTNKLLSKGLCSKHYKRISIHGTTDTPKRAPGRIEERFWRFVNKGSQDDCWLWSGGSVAGGYGTIMLEDQSTGLAHRVSYEINIGPIPKGRHVLHKCDTRMCVNPAHLFIGSNAQNMADRNSKGRQVRGVSHPMAKLTINDVFEIRQSSLTQTEIAEKYGVTQSTVSSIILRKTWRHI